jgi:hypothetical protein
MKMIYKYPLGNEIRHNMVTEIDMPRNAQILDIQMQGDIPVLWAIVNPKKPSRKYVFHVFGTGYEMLDYEKKHYVYVGTVQQRGMMTLVWHIFEVIE